ncbi:MAG: ABC transporter permease, partial [Gammaproteobacteria bacterium]
MAGLAEIGSQLAQDLRYAWRSFRGSPAFALTAIATIGLGVGVNTGIFSIVNAIAFGEISATNPDELVSLQQDVQGVPRASNNYSPFTRPEYEAYRDRTETLTGVAAYGRMWDATLGGDTPRMIIATPVSCNFFDVLGRPPQIGGTFSSAHCEEGADAAVAVITHEMWIDRFEGDESVLGQTVTLNGSEFQIIGVAPEGFVGIDLDRASLFVPIEARETLRPDRNFFDDDTLSWLNLVGRLDTNVSAEQVEAEWNVIARQLDAERPERVTTVSVAPARRLSAPVVRTVVLAAAAIVMTAFGLVLLVACTNVANLMLARADLRMRDTAIRSSLGATRGRLIRQFVFESVLIALCGGLAGSVLALWTIDGLVLAALSALPPEARIFFSIEPEASFDVFLFAAGLSMLAGIGFGLAPALAATRTALRTTIDQDSSGGGIRTRGRLQGVLVGVQVAFSMMLVVATALLLRGFYETLT